MRTLLKPFRRTALGELLARSVLRPQHWRPSFAAARTLWFGYGHLKSVRSLSAVDAANQPVPWYTYPAIEYLKQFDFAESRVFEYGSGNSTLFWANRAASVVSVEDDEHWHASALAKLRSNCTLILEPDLQKYVDVIRRYPDGFDIVVVDGPARGLTRLKCARAAVDHLRAGGLIILDNSDWLPASARYLRESGFLQVDMSGFIPIGGHTQTTSFFFHRACELRPIGGRQPHPSLGALSKNWDTPTRPEGQTVEWGGETIDHVVTQSSLTKESPTGKRMFEIAIRDGGSGPREIHIFDVDQQRILVGGSWIPNDETTPDTITRFDHMSWEGLCAFVRRSHVRRYVLD
jgi:hypothetical protein